jgi:peptidoglycan/xylan/chitin deacetylase (PgdA/CDA1 family)
VLKFFAIFLLLSGSVQACSVLLYHHFSDKTPFSTSISPALFEQHLQYLQDNQFSVLSLEAMLSGLISNTLPDKCVVLTADDAYISIYKNAYPLLKKYQMPMAVFVSSGGVDNRYKALMSWEMMRRAKGVLQFYNHSVSHPHLIDLNEKLVEKEITYAQNRLQIEVGTSRKIFAYPYGESSLNISQKLKHLGYVAFGQHSGVVSGSSDLQNLPRFPMAANFAKMRSFKVKVNALSMPIFKQNIDTVINISQPILGLHFRRPMSQFEQKNLQCYITGGAHLFWQDDQTLWLVAKTPLTERRSKYNCTLPSSQKGRYYWHSVQWVNPYVAE